MSARAVAALGLGVRRRLSLGLCLGVSLGLLAGCHSSALTPAPPPSSGALAAAASPALARPAREVTSNILRGDYAGSAACARCHPAIAAAWQRSPMHNMTRLASPPATVEVHAPFDGSGIDFKADRARAERRDGQRWVRVESKAYGDHAFRVTRVIGGHHREDFVGVEAGGDGTERVLPLSWLIADRRWRYKGYSVMVVERPGIKVVEPWAKTCIFCHNTAPYLDALLGTLAGEATPTYQGEVVDQHLPIALRHTLEVTDGQGLRRAVSDELRVLGARPAADRPLDALLHDGVRGTRQLFDGQHLVEVGIGCESCHGGSREHVDDPHARPVFGVRSPLLRERAPAPTSPASEAGSPSTAAPSAASINRVCARCHQVLFSRYPWTWEGTPRASHAGGSNINSGEARDFLLGHCSGAMSCVQCHDPHAPDNRARMDALDGEAGDRVCLGCHAKYSGPAAIAAHTHHSPTGAGARCLGCHMPRKNLSLELRLTRYHRVGSPTDGAKVLGDRPLECALCHVDRSVESIVSDMERLWGKRYDRPALRRLYGDDLSVNAMRAALASQKPHEVATAATVLGVERVAAAIPELVRQLGNTIPLVREFVLRALERIVGAPSHLELHRDVAAIEADARRWLGLAAGAMPTPAPVADVPDVEAP